ncbi:MAG: START domain-containing protein [Candidatus Omnitrophica bacterium]|nr:START domain-containing protein [Candidatus Omnitrophota bacterium]
MKFIVCGFLMLASLFLEEASAAEYPWKLRINKEEITVYTRKVEASPILEYKANMIVGAKLDKVIRFFEDVKKMPQWYYQCIQAGPLASESAEKQIIYFVLHLPWPVAERDCVFSWVKSLDPVSREVSYTLSVVSGKFPEQKGKIRVLDLNSIWRFTPLKDGRTEVYFQQHSNPGGSIPLFLVNKLSVEIPFYSLKNLRKMINEIEYEK